MRIDLGLILAVIVEYIAFIYYSNTLFYRKKNLLFCSIVITLGYLVHFFICIFGDAIINTATFIILNIVSFILCFHINSKTAIFQGTILAVLSVLCEVSTIYICKLGINVDNIVNITSMQSIILTMVGKSLYLMCVMILSNLFRKNCNYTNTYSILLVLIPILTIFILVLTLRIYEDTNLQLTICALCMLIDVIVFIINQNIITQHLENETLRLQTKKDEKTFEDYMALKHLNHDMDEHLGALYSLIDSNNDQAKEYIKSLNSKKQELTNIIDYTDNSMINIVLSKKMMECKEQGIVFSLEPVQAHLKFFKDMDAVTIFSNLLNNAIESCIYSTEKKIHMRIYTVNKNFVVIKLENSSDKKPLVIDGKLKTHKDNEQLHGIGINSIKQTLKEYNGTLLWSYDEKTKMFCSMITIQHLNKKLTYANNNSIGAVIL